MGDNEISDAKNEGKSLAISIAMAMQRYVAGRIVGGPAIILAKNKPFLELYHVYKYYMTSQV